MQTITIDDATYKTWEKQASSQGITVQEWLKHLTVLTVDDSAPNPEEFTAEERLSMFNESMDFIESLDIRSGCEIDWSRENMYRDRMNRQLPNYHENND